MYVMHALYKVPQPRAAARSRSTHCMYAVRTTIARISRIKIIIRNVSAERRTMTFGSSELFSSLSGGMIPYPQHIYRRVHHVVFVDFKNHLFRADLGFFALHIQPIWRLVMASFFARHRKTTYFEAGARP